MVRSLCVFFFFRQKTAYEMRISDWSSDVCSSDLMTDYLAIALLHHSNGVTVTDSLDVTEARHLDLGQLHLATRINISEWQNNKQSKQYISFIKGKNGKDRKSVV